VIIYGRNVSSQRLWPAAHPDQAIPGYEEIMITETDLQLIEEKIRPDA
jgi:hypothetical protein